MEPISPLAALWLASLQLAQVAQFPQALALSLATGVASVLLALGATAAILSTGFGMGALRDRAAYLPAMLALPHIAFALGAVMWLAPSGVLLRLAFALFAPVASWVPWSMDAPPPWQTTQDPWGLGLVLVLTCKEIPFLLWAAVAQLQRPDTAQGLQSQLRVAATLGYSASTAWWRIVWPQLLPRMGGPLLAVWAYSVSVVDVAWIIGPGAPPTLAVLAWQWIMHADPALRAQGLASVMCLMACTAVLALLAALGYRAYTLGPARARWTRGLVLGAEGAAGETSLAQRLAHALPKILAVLYGLIFAALLWASFAGAWPFPFLLPQSWTFQAWQQIAFGSAALGTTLWLGLASATGALLFALLCLECLPQRWHRALFVVAYGALGLPTLLWAIGLQRLCIALDWDGRAVGLCLAHILTVLPYVLISLQGPYAALDRRARALAATLGRGVWSFLWQVQWPLLRSAFAAAFAVGFAVSVAQFLPTLFAGAGRFETVTTEALALSSGGQRALLATYALWQCLLPVLVFALAASLGRPRRFPLLKPAQAVH